MSSALSSPRQMSHTETKQDLFFFLVHPTCCFLCPRYESVFENALTLWKGNLPLHAPGGGSFAADRGHKGHRASVGTGVSLHVYCTPISKGKKGENTVIRECLEESTQELHKLNVKVNEEGYPLLGISNKTPSILWKWAHLTAGSLFPCFQHHMDRGENPFTFLLVCNTKAFVKYLDS